MFTIVISVGADIRWGGKCLTFQYGRSLAATRQLFSARVTRVAIVVVMLWDKWAWLGEIAFSL